MNLYTGLAIGELSKRTGVGVSTLRAWERRFGFPVPARMPGGHRRFTETDVAMVAEVVRARANGSSLDAAIARVMSGRVRPGRSVFAAVCAELPRVTPTVLSKPAMSALSNAIEDEASIREDRPVFVGAFQESRFWQPMRPQWRAIARTAELTVALAAGVPRRNVGRLWQVPIRATDPIAQEWAVICDASGFAACVVGREVENTRGRRFDALWTVEPVAVRAALRAALDLAVEAAPALVDLVPSRVREPATVTHESLRHATVLMTRVVAYLDR